MKVCYLDHYDSFSFNLIDCLFSDRGVELLYLGLEELMEKGDSWFSNMPLVISPGPHRPETLPSTVSCIRRHLGRVPILGVCLGHQCLGYAVGGRISHGKNPFHGSRQKINVLQDFDSRVPLPSSFMAAQYNSLVIDRASMPREFVWATNEDDEVAGIMLKNWGQFPALGIQFHPESFLSEEKEALTAIWIHMVRDFYENTKVI